MLLFVLAFVAAPAWPAAPNATNPSPRAARCGRTSDGCEAPIVVRYKVTGR